MSSDLGCELESDTGSDVCHDVGHDIGNLIVSRFAGESIQIGDQIEIEIVSIRGDKVRVAVKAPRSVRVLRSELLTREPPKENPACVCGVAPTLPPVCDHCAGEVGGG